MKIVASFREPYAAHLAKGLLEAHDIPAVIADEHIVGMNWLYSQAVGGVKVKVADEHYDTAREALKKDYRGDLDLVDESKLPPAPEDRCAKCGSDSISPNRYSMWCLIPSLAFTVPFFFRRRQHRCDECGHKW